MQWNARTNGGFTDDEVEPWLPLDDPASCNVHDQKADRTSVLNLCRDLIALRRARSELGRGGYASTEAPPGVWAWKRGQISVAVNCSDLPVDIDVASGVVLIGTRRERDGRPVDGPLRLEPWEGVALAANDPDA